MRSLGDYGYRPTDLVRRAQDPHRATIEHPRAAAGAAPKSAGLEDIEIADVIVDSGLDDPEAITAYRTGLGAHRALRCVAAR